MDRHVEIVINLSYIYRNAFVTMGEAPHLVQLRQVSIY